MFLRDSFASEIYGKEIHKLILPDDIVDAPWLIEEYKPDMVCCFAPFSFRGVMENLGFRLVSVRLTYRALVGADRVMRTRPIGINCKQVKKLGKLTTLSIAEAIAPTSRFYKDELLDKAATHRLFEKWVANSVDGYADLCIAASDPDGKVVGFHSLKRQPDAVYTDLIAVLDGYGGHGIGSFLLDAGMSVTGASVFKVVTEAENVGACRLYERNGYLLDDMQLVYHKHFPRREQQ